MFLSLLIALTCYLPVLADDAGEGSENVLVMDEIEVEAPLDPPVIINPTRTSTSFNLEEIESRQADNIFEIIDDIPGVSLSGGPRANGIDVNIRGFGNNEDIIYKIDGAIKNFEKYRFGGTFIEPELLKRIEVTRGAATTTIGSGALGGVIEMETKDASDFLKPGQRFGVNTKYGHRFNNDEQIASVTMYGAPTEKLDMLFNITDREANDYKLTGEGISATSDNLAASSVVPSSGLAKLEYYPNDNVTLGLSFSRYLSKGIEPLDTSVTSVAGGFGTVDRESDDKTYAGKFLYNPLSDLIDLKVTIGFSDIEVSEISLGDGFSTEGDITDFEYDIWAVEAKNISLFDIGKTSHALTLGIDGEYSDRETSRVFAFFGPESFGVAAQPSGIYQQYGLFLVDEISLGNLTLTPGVRWDYNHARVTFDDGPGNIVDLLKSSDQDTSESFDIVLPSFSASYKFGSSPFTVFYNYWEQYRPPKIDESFSTGAAGFGRCLSGIDEEPYVTTRVCGDLFEPEESTNNDFGLLIEKIGYLVMTSC